MTPEQATERAAVLKALSHPSRVRIVDELSRGDRCGLDLVALLGGSQSVVSRHLAALRAVGIVSERKDGARVLYHLASPCILRALDCTMDVLVEAHERQRQAIEGDDG